MSKKKKKEVVPNYDWVKYKAGILKDKNIQEIFDFYVLRCPKDGSSKMGFNINEYFEPEELKSKDFEEYFIKSVGLINGKTYKRINTYDDFENAAKEIKFNNKQFYKSKKEKIIVYVGWQDYLLVNILYSIRCGLAHGCFKISNKTKEKTIVLENYDNNRKKIKARMVLRINTLLKIKKLVINGREPFIKYIDNRNIEIIKTYKKLLQNYDIKNQNELKDLLGESYEKVKLMCEKYNYAISKIKNKYKIENK